MKHDFEQRKENRITYAKEQAARNEQLSDHYYVKATEMASVIPMGQPILVGHHSEKRDRNYRNQIHNTFGKSVEASRKQKYYEDKAETIENNTAISSDDPQALEKLKNKLADLQASQAFMKAANKCIRNNDMQQFLKLPLATEKMWYMLITPDCMKQTGFPHYKLANNNAAINATKKRIAQLEKIATFKTQELAGNGVRLVQNVEAGRIQLIFDHIPSEEVRTKLKQHGFKWCRSEQAWQRHLNGNGVYAGKTLFNLLSKKDEDNDCNK